MKIEDITYQKYKDAQKGLYNFLNENSERQYDDKTGIETLKVDWLILNIGIPNCLLVIEGYGLKTQRDLIRFELENAKLKGADKTTIVDLEYKFKETEKQLKYFLRHKSWVD